MPNQFDGPDEGTTSGRAETLAERIERGRSTGKHADGAIVPFPDGFSGASIPAGLTGDDRKKVEYLLSHGYRHTAYEYRSAEGELIQMVIRFDHPTERKSIRPLRYLGRSERGGPLFWMTFIEGQRPLYGLDYLARRPDAPVLVVEGEKTADAAAKLFPEHVAITWMSGANSVHRAEMTLLEGRKLVLWPDNDPPGRAAMRKFAAFAYQAGAGSVAIVDVPPEFGEKWDLADDLPPAIAADNLLIELIRDARLIAPSEVAHLIDRAEVWAEHRRLLGYKPGYTNVPIEAAETALSLLDACMYGNQWREVARCLFYAYGDAALPAFERWSQDCSDKYRRGEPAKLWAAYKGDKSFRGKPLAWLFRLAEQALAERTAGGSADVPNVQLDAEARWLASIEELSEDHAVVTRGGKTVVMWENYDPRFERFSETYLAKKDFIDRHVRSVTLPPDAGADDGKPKKTKRSPQGGAWFNSNRRRSYESVVFAPGRTLDPRFLNSWRGFTVEPTDNPDGWSRFKQHLHDHVAGGDAGSFEYLLNWFAFAVQHLNVPIGTALILVGPKGAGKSIITQIFGYLFGPHAFVTSRMEDATGRFNDRLETTILLGLEEAVAPQNRAADGTLKDLVTRPTLRLEGKFFGIWDAPNHLRIIVTSNNEHVVRADGSERRYAVFDVTNPYQADATERRRYFGSLMEQMETGGYQAMLGELLARDVSDWNAERMPETEALKRQKLASLSTDPVRMYLYARLTDGIFITTGDTTPAVPIYRWSTDDTVWVPARHINEDFLAYASANGLRATERQLALQLPKYMPAGFEAKTRRAPEVDGKSSTFKAYPFPPLDDARRLFEAATQISIPRESAE